MYGGGLTKSVHNLHFYTKVKLIDNNIYKLLCFNVLYWCGSASRWKLIEVQRHSIVMQLPCFVGEMWAQRCGRRATPPHHSHLLTVPASPLPFMPYLHYCLLFSLMGFLWPSLIGFSENFPPHSLSVKHLHINTFTLPPAEHLSAHLYYYTTQSLSLVMLGVFRKFCPVCVPFKPSAISLQSFQ